MSFFPKKLCATAFALGIMTLGCAGLSDAQTIPGGSYQNSCRELTVNGSTLTATCQRADGAYVRTSLRDVRTCQGDIRNQNGALDCDRHADQAYPDGNYLQTCNNVSMRGYTLVADCRRGNGSYVRSELRNAAVCPGNISNQNGTLTCDQRGTAQTPPSQVARPLPGGTYQQSCDNIRVDGDQLYATCKRTDGSFRNSSTVFRKGSIISNCDGFLTDAPSCPRNTPTLEDSITNSVTSIINDLFQ